jgi:hypothetical protein
MLTLNINNCIVVETDVLVFCDLYDKFNTYFNINNCDAFLAEKNTICCSYISKIYLETFCNTALTMYSDKNICNCLTDIYSSMNEGGICDMTINDWINNETVYSGMFTNLNSEKKKIIIEELSVLLPDNSFFDDFLINIKNFDSQDTNVGLIKKIYNINDEPYFKLNNNYIKCNSIHFQGHRKEIMPDIFNDLQNVPRF